MAKSIAINHDVEVVMPTGNIYGGGIEDKNPRSGSVGNVNYRFLGFRSHPRRILGKLLDNFLGSILPLFYLVRQKIYGRVDSVFIYNSLFFPNIMVVALCKLLNIKVVSVLPEFYEEPPKYTLPWIKWCNFYLGLKLVATKSDKLIVLTSFLERYVKEKLKFNGEVLVQPNFVKLEDFQGKNIRRPDNGQITVGYIGTPTKKDGVTDLIRSFAVVTKEIPNLRLLVIGDLTNGKSLLPELKNLAGKLGVSNNVTFTGLVSIKEVPALLQTCDVLALTRPNGITAEAGFPTKLGEYFASQRAVIITKVGDIPRYFQSNREVVLVEPENIDSIAQGLKYLIQNESIRHELAQNGYEWAKQNLCYVSVSSKLNAFISKN